MYRTAPNISLGVAALSVLFCTACGVAPKQPADEGPAEKTVQVPTPPVAAPPPRETAAITHEDGPLTDLPASTRECVRRAWGDTTYSQIEGGQRQPLGAEDEALKVCLAVNEEPPERPVEPVSPRVRPGWEAVEAWLPIVRGGEFLVAALGPYADAELLALPAGGYRMYVEELGAHNIISFFSADGLEWIREEGVRISGAAFPDALQLDDGRLRLYFQAGGQIASAISSDDGLTFEREPGLRVDRGWHGELDRDNVGASTTVRLPNGRFRMYYRAGVEDEAYVNRQKNVILSATSEDGLTWTPDEGVRLAPEDWLPPDAPPDIRYVDGPEAAVTGDGQVKLYFWGVRLCAGVCLSLSEDGLSFESVEQVYAIADSPGRVNIGDPTLLQLSDGSWLMFHGHAVDGQNGIWIARRQR